MSADEPAERMKRKDYEKELEKLQVELCHLQEWVKAEKLKVIIIFEGRDAAGKGGTIKALDRKGQPAGVPRLRPARAVRPAKIPVVPAALYRAIPGRRRNRDLRP